MIMKLSHLNRNRRWTVLAAALALMLAAVSLAQSSDKRLFTAQLWNPDHPVDIYVYNPNREPLELPPPMTLPTYSEFHGKGINENNLPDAVKVGGNITISIDYQDSTGEGFYDATLGSARRSAFSQALAIWASYLQGPATITIAASMTPRGGGPGSATLASSGPEQWRYEPVNAPVAQTWYPSALAEIVGGVDIDPDRAEIAVDYNSDVDNSYVLGSIDWYYGNDANPGNDVDFMMVTLHEMCHGFGMVASFKSTGTWGLDYDGTLYPVIYDRYLVDSSGTLLINKPVSPSVVTGHNVFWNGAIAKYAYTHDFGGTFRLPIYAPTPWDGGSSISHIDEATFSESIWELITPEYDEPIIHTPDLICLGIFQDMGHSLSQSRYVKLTASGFEDGSSGNPYNTITEGTTNVPSGGHLRIYSGSYAGARTITKAMTLHSCGGTTVLGTAKSATAPADTLRGADRGAVIEDK